MKKTEDLPPLKGYMLEDIPDPVVTPISPEARALTIAILAVASELRLNRMSLENGPAWKMAELTLNQIRQQMGGIVPGVIVPGNH